MYENFKVSNKQLNEMREQYFIELAKKKLEDFNSVWDNDQLDPLNLYRKEKERTELIIKKEIAIYQNQVQEIGKNYQNGKKNYVNQYKICHVIKNKIEERIESKSAFESVFAMLKNEKNKINDLKKYPETNRNINSSNKKGKNLYYFIRNK